MYIVCCLCQKVIPLYHVVYWYGKNSVCAPCEKRIREKAQRDAKKKGKPP